MKCSLCSEEANAQPIEIGWIDHGFGMKQKPPKLYYTLCKGHQKVFSRWCYTHFAKPYEYECEIETRKQMGDKHTQMQEELYRKHSELGESLWDEYWKIRCDLLSQFKADITDNTIYQWTQEILEKAINRQKKGLSINICVAMGCIYYEHQNGLCKTHFNEMQKGSLIIRKDDPSCNPIRDAVLKLYNKEPK